LRLKGPEAIILNININPTAPYQYPHRQPKPAQAIPLIQHSSAFAEPLSYGGLSCSKARLPSEIDGVHLTGLADASFVLHPPALHIHIRIRIHTRICVSVSLADAADIRATLRMSNMQAQFTSSDSEVHPCLAECTTHLINHLINYSLSGLPLHGGK